MYAIRSYYGEAQALSQQGDYLFDPGIGELIKLWGFQSDEFASRPPDESRIKAWLAEKPSIADISVDGNVGANLIARHAADLENTLASNPQPASELINLV